MAKIKIEIKKESEAHAAWKKNVEAIEEIGADQRTDEQWEELAKLYESEPELDEGSRTFYVPTFDETPATTLQRLPKRLLSNKNTDAGNAFEFTFAYLNLFMPRAAVQALTITQMNEIGSMLNPQGETSA